MNRVLMIESAAHGLLTVNGQFCGPLEKDGQAFPMGRSAQAYIQLIAYDPQIRPLAAALEFRDGQVTRLEPRESCYALIWPDGVVQLELRPQMDGGAGEAKTGPEKTPASVLLRYLHMRLAGDEEAQRLLMRAQDGISLAGYDAVVPLRFAPITEGDRFDERAGIVRRIAPNAAVVDAVLATTVPIGQGRKMIERMEIVRT